MKWLLNAGLTDSTPVSERTKVYLLNRLILVCMSINIGIFVLDMFLGVYVNGLANLGLISIYYPLYLLHHKGKYALVRNLFSILINTFIVVMSVATYHQDRWTETENILFASIAATIFLYNKRGRIAAVLIVSIILFGLKFYKFQYFGLPWDSNFTLTIVNNSLTIVALYFFMAAFQKEFTSAVERTVFLNDGLNRQKEELEIKEKRLTELNDTKNKLFSVVAHDLKNPLNLLYGLVQMSNDGNFSGPELKSHNERIQKNLHSVNHMLNNVLIWAKSQLDGYKIQKEIIVLEYLVEEVIIFYSEMAESKDLTFKTDIKSDLAVLVDQNLLKIALRNVINNAIKYSHEGGQIKIYEKIHGDDVFLCVEDQGVGMTKEIISKIRSEEMIDSEYGTGGEAGTGLGLKLCNEMLKMNDSELLIDSEPGHGTKMKIKLALVKVDEVVSKA